MTETNKEQIFKIVQSHIKDPIEIVLENKKYRAAVILILTGIDTMAYLSMPANKKTQDCHDFIEWADKYILFEGGERLTGLELYITRCIILHSYSDYSSLLNLGNCREIEYTDQSNTEASDRKIKVSINALADAFFKGFDKFFDSLFLDNEKALLVKKRLDKITLKFPVNK
jgi:hypothetical protein